MSVSGVCQICESGEARFACDQCGRVVCADHYDRQSGLCTECARRLEPGDGDRSADRGGRGESRDDWGEPR